MNVEHLLEAAKNALETGERITSAWPAYSIKGSVWEAATFDVDGSPWGVVHGAQRPGLAQMLDAAAAYAHHHGGRKVLALIGPDGEHEPAPEVFRKQFQSAAWHGLGIVWVEADGPGAGQWSPGEPRKVGDVAALAESCKRALEQAVAQDRATWAALVDTKDSTGAEPHVRKAVGGALAPHGFGAEDAARRKFSAFWRGAIADGVWSRPGGSPSSIALEVKVGEDGSAPLCQVFDDLGQFDAAFLVRLTRGETPGRVPKGMKEAMHRAEEALPVRYIDLNVAG